MNYYKSFKDFWLEIYKKQHKSCKTLKEKRAIKSNFFKNINLTLKQKEEMWEEIVK